MSDDAERTDRTDHSRCKACKGTGRLSTEVIDGERPAGWVTCPWGRVTA